MKNGKYWDPWTTGVGLTNSAPALRFSFPVLILQNQQESVDIPYDAEHFQSLCSLELV